MSKLVQKFPTDIRLNAVTFSQSKKILENGKLNVMYVCVVLGCS